MRWLLVFCLSFAMPALAVDEVSDFGANPGDLAMFEHVPANLPAGPRPLVVVLHGCSQDHEYAQDAGLVDVADELGVLLAIAEQTSANNAQACFNWFEEGDITRDEGEALSIKQMVDDMKARHDVDDARVFVTGVSSGGAMTAVMLATYPDVFAAGAVFAGVAYRCGVGLVDAFSCMSSGGSGSQEEWAALVNGAHGLGAEAPKPRIMIWHGSDDATVDVANADDLVEQWTGVHGLSLTPTSTSMNGDISRETFGADAQVENVRISGMDHGTPVDPGNGPAQCGTAGSFFLDVNVCATREVFAFFGIDADDDPPLGEGEGEGEGEGGEGEGEGEGEAPAACGSAASSSFAIAALLAVIRFRSVRSHGGQGRPPYPR